MSQDMCAEEVAMQPEFLAACLSKALGDDGLVTDIIEASRLCGISAVTLGSGQLDVNGAAEKLYLTEEEARAVLNVCRQECMMTGAIKCDESMLELMNNSSEPQKVAFVEQAAVVVEADVAPKKKQVADSNAHKRQTVSTVQRKASGSVNAPVLDVANVPADKPVKKPTAVLSPSKGCENKPNNSKKSAPASVPETVITAEELMAVLNPIVQPQRSVTPPIKRKKNVLSSIGSTLLKPTAAFLARMSRQKETTVDPSLHESKSMASQRLSQILSSPSGKRVTKAEPFQLRTSTRTKASMYQPTEELELKKAMEEAKKIKPLPVPKSCKEHRPLELRVQSTPKKPDEIQRPFELASSKRHEKAQEEIRQKLESERKAEASSREFHARPFSITNPLTPTPKKSAQVTIPTTPRFRSEERIAHYHSVVDPARKAKEEAAAAEAAAEEARKAAEAAAAVLELRKSLVFKARDVPDFSSPFKPDLSLSSPVTQPKEVELPTDKRLGKKELTASMGKMELSTIATFSSSLRSSCVFPSAGSNSMRLRSSLRASTSSMTFGRTKSLMVAAH